MFLASVVAATLVPLSSEAVLFAYLRLFPEHAAAAIALAAIGNTAGGMTTYLIGRLVPERTREKLDPRALGWLARYGSPATFFAWLPLVGDALCLAAGWARLNWVAVALWSAAGRFARYWLVAQGALW